MATDTVNLPEGFVIDQVNNTPSVPKGFVIDEGSQEPFLNILKKNAQEAYNESFGTVAQGVNTALFGIPKAVTQKISSRAAQAIFPEQKTLAGKTMRAIAEGAGYVAGGPGKLATKIGTRVLPKATSLLAKAGKGAIEGAVALGARVPTPQEAPTLKKASTEILSKAATGAALGGTIPLAGKVAQGAKEVWNRSAASYINDVVVPKAYNAFQANVRNFGEGIQKFARDKLKIPESVINNIKEKGTQHIQKIRNNYNDSTDAIFQKINTGFQKMESQADDAYIKAVDSFKGNTIDSTPFYQSIQKGLRLKGWVDLRGNPTTRYKGGLDPVADKLTDLYLDMARTTTKAGKRISGMIMSKEDFFTYRDALSSMLKEKPSDRLVMQARNSLYGSAEKSGMTGIKAARDLESKYYSMRDRFLNDKGELKSLGKEQSLDRFHKLSQDQVRQLRDIENYTGEKFVDDLESLTSARYLDKLEKYDVKKFSSDLSKAVSRSETNAVKEEYRDLLGNKTDDIFNDIISHRRAKIVKKGAKIAGGIAGYELLRRNLHSIPLFREEY